MSFLDPAFLFCFLPITLALFGAAGRFLGPPGGNIVLILSTVVFCLPFGWPFVTVVLASALVNAVAFVILIRETRAERARLRTYVFVGTLVFNFALLITIKYGVIFEGVPVAAPFFAMIANSIPITISFFTFQRMVMLCDAYQRRPETLPLAERDLRGILRLGSFSLMFPNLVIGPIVYVSEVGSQLCRRGFGRLRRVDFEVAVTLLVIGLAKKILIADPLNGYVVGPVFGALSAGQKLVPLEAAMGVIGFYAQLYFDFSGYSDIAIGIARMFGLVLPLNFNSPLRAAGIMDFYRRWHITLTRVIAKLLFTPLAVVGTRFVMKQGITGGRSKVFTNWLPFLVNFEVIGLWHGARWTYVAFGFYHGLWFILETEVRSTKLWKQFVKRTSARLRLRTGQAITFLPLAISFALFRCGSLRDFSHLMASFYSNWLAVLSDSSGRVLNTREPVVYLGLSFAIIWLLPNAYEFMRNYRPGIITFAVPSTTPRWAACCWRPTLVWAVMVSLLALAVIRSLNAPSPFVYGGF